MDVFTMVVIIVAIGCATGVITSYFETKKKQAKHTPRPDDGLLDELDELRNRIEVLEKIVTDQRFQLSRELDDLERRA